MSRGKVAAGATAAILLAAAAIVKPWEGLRTAPYRDIVGVTTVCYGSTKDVEARRYTVAECEALLKSDLAEHWAGVSKCIARPLAEHQAAAVLSWTFNVGVDAACRSTLVRKINAGLPASQWCGELLKWDYADGKRVRGLTNRRVAEYRACVGEAK